MNYGYRSRSKSAASSYRRRSGSYGGYSKKFGAYKKGGRKPRYVKFATVGFSRNIEKKYFDKTYQANANETLTGQTAPRNVNNGVTYISNQWGDYTFGTQQATATSVSNDMLKGVATGTTARTRIGNKIKIGYVKGAFSFTAANTEEGLAVFPQGGEQVVEDFDTKRYYLRTTFRFVIVKDMQVNSTETNVTWQQVFDTSGQQAGVHSELNVDNMGRFMVLEDKIFTCDADDPQKTIPFMVKGNRLGSVRYNGPNGTALTDKGLYVIWAAFVMGAAMGDHSYIGIASPVGHSRLCFTDE